MTTGVAELIERVARAICKARGFDPDKCLLGYSWAAGELGRAEAGSVCHRRAWQEYVGEAEAAIEATGVSRQSMEIERLRNLLRSAKPFVEAIRIDGAVPQRVRAEKFLDAIDEALETK